ncbi:integral membrane protein [Geosmithia morbida]|uniref:Integral membrane protein n=1 Tax=Geosmithia morbida TaxID=1094350 RepID=A0A9P5D2V5_9HYPO|nr:uncharacterized protein GMORB2_1716 [Geosmithia morbida]KAF4121876.1 integral membrane protein [Geosmithia morbida]
MATGTIDLTGLENGSTNNPLDTAKANLPLHMTVAAFTGIAWYNVLELNLAVYLTFRRRSGLYFWSVVSSIWGIAVHSSAFVLKLYGVVPQYGVTVTLITLGWYAMVTGQALVLYSRLHLVVGDVPRLVTAVLAMIVLNAVCMHVPMTVLTYGSNSPHWRDFVDGFRVMEKLQMSVFCVQEFAISAVYIWATLRFLGGPVWHRRHVRSVMLQLFWINVAIIAMDLAMLTMEYLGRYFLEAVMKGAIYSVKLKLEFAVLNQLMQIATSSRRRQRRAAHHHHRHHHHHQHRRLHHLDHAAASGRHAGLEGDGRPTSFRAWLKRFVPGPVATTSDDDVSDDDDNNNFISPSFFQSTNNNDDDNDEEIANSAPPPRRRHAVSPPYGRSRSIEQIR